MINATELRIGNLFWENYGGYKIVASIIHSQYEGHTIQAKGIGYEAIGQYSLKDCYPIPLTPEILEKCGFVCSGDWYYKQQFILGFITTDNHFQTEYKMAGVEGDWKLLDIQYLHQLQNLYFAQTGEELNYQNTTIQNTTQ